MFISRKLISFLFLSLLYFPLYLVHATESVLSYQQALDKFMGQQKKQKKDGGFSKSDKAIMKKSGEDLAKKMPSPGLTVGDKAPDFTLKNAFGNKVTLSNVLKKGPVILSFYRGAWCPFCSLQLHTLHKSMPTFKKYNAQLVLVTPQTPDKSKGQLEKGKYTFEVLSDLDSKVMKSYKLFYKLDADLVRVYKKHGLDVESFNGKGRNVLPVPGTYVIDKNSVIRAAYADTDYKKRMEPQAIIDALKKL
ncbi:MAG: peroxiredoxin-like family protein [Gammaproteobacteria bacterium]|nr:MAG: peroxiredoxin-like family protein [Gammaproteobacteria bacterium]